MTSTSGHGRLRGHAGNTPPGDRGRLPSDPIIVLTAHALPNPKDMIEAGFTDSLVKPVARRACSKPCRTTGRNTPPSSRSKPYTTLRSRGPCGFSRLFFHPDPQLDKIRHVLAQNDLDILLIIGHGLRFRPYLWRWSPCRTGGDHRKSSHARRQRRSERPAHRLGKPVQEAPGAGPLPETKAGSRERLP